MYNHTCVVLLLWVYILATFLESFPCPIVQNQVILPPKMAKGYTCAAFDQATELDPQVDKVKNPRGVCVFLS